MNRTIAPPITDAVNLDIALPKYDKHVLSNGVEVFLFNMGTQDTMMLNWVFDAGNWYEEKNLVAAATNHLLKNGTSQKNAFAINEAFEFYGAYLNRNCYNETAEVSLHCLSKHVQDVLPVVAELISDSTMPEEEVAIYKKNMQQRLKVNLQKSEFVAHRQIEAHLFGSNHPYGKFSTEEEYSSLQQNELKEFFNKYYKNGRCVIFAAGVMPKNLIQQLESSFGHLPLKKHVLPTEGYPIFSSEEKKFRQEISKDGVQGSIRVARLFPNRLDPDFPKMQVLNNVLGGFFGSRLMDNIREDKGYTYGVHSYLLNHIQTSALMISTEAGKDVCEPALVEIYKEMEELCTEEIPEDELMLTRNYLLGSILSELDGPFQVAARWKNYILNGLTEDYFYNSVNIIRTIQPKELQALARKYFDKKEFYELIVT
ncbi:MAG TPA: pitrilysin family protein [Chitinophagaceae bacterium]|nr:pitrilysin family protein [Chitinophagaceae bacterium]